MNNVKHNVDIKIIHSNTDGYKSKKESINEIADKESPDIMTLNDTNLKGNLKVKVPGYFSFNKNREKYKGGVATVIANYLKHNTMKVAEGKEEDEYIITRIDNTIPEINIINIYGTQESKTSKDEIEHGWYRLLKEIHDIENRNEAVILIGDMNRHVGNGEYGIRGNISKISHGGQLIQEMIKDGQYILINHLDLVKGGPWTFVDRQDNNRKSCLDLAIMSVALNPYLKTAVIDSERNFTPRRVTKTKNTIKSTYTDHYSMKLELKGIPKKIQKENQPPTLNINKPGGRLKFKSLTNEVAEKVKDTIDEDIDIDKVMNKIDIIERKFF